MSICCSALWWLLPADTARRLSSNNQAPRLDLVPLFPTCGWSLHTAACLADVASVLVAPHGRGRPETGQLAVCDDVAEHWDEGAGTSDEGVMAAVQAARAAAGLPPLPVHPLPPPPPKRGALPSAYPGSMAPDTRPAADGVAAQGNAGGIAQNGALLADGANGTASHNDGGDGSGQEAAAWCYDAVAVGGTFDRLHGARFGPCCIPTLPNAHTSLTLLTTITARRASPVAVHCRRCLQPRQQVVFGCHCG